MGYSIVYKIWIHDFGNSFIIGNNGREFTLEDIESLCRSGSSNKKRGGNTIGYRGIGFKSVVNLAKQVFIFSGDFNLFFDKQETKNIITIDSDVPLIRVPHSLKEEHKSLKEEILKIKKENNYNSVFLFKQVNDNIFINELREFDRSSLLFLNSLTNILINHCGINRNICLEHSKYKEAVRIKIIEDEIVEEWSVESSKNNTSDSIAFKIEDK